MNPSTPTAVTLEWRDGNKPNVRILAVTGSLVISNFFDFQAALRDSKASVTILDFKGVPYIDSAALGAILGAHGRHGGKLALAAVDERITALFSMSGVSDILKVFPTVEAAEAALA